MKLLLVAATPLETVLLRASLGLKEVRDGLWENRNGELCLLHTGIGMVNTAFRLGQVFANHPVEQAINFGIAGAWDRSLPLGGLVEVVSDCFAELGADSPQGYLNLETIGFPLWQSREQVVYNEIHNPKPSHTSLDKVKGLSINRVSGTEAGIKARYQEWPRQVESMEGAAFFQACLMAEVPFYAFRSISNYVEPRNRKNWELQKAVESIQHFMFAFVRDLD